MKEEPDIVTVWITDYLRAIVLKGKLESEGIPTLLSAETVGPTWGGITVDGLGLVEIKVPARYAKEAKEILEEIGLR